VRDFALTLRRPQADAAKASPGVVFRVARGAASLAIAAASLGASSMFLAATGCSSTDGSDGSDASGAPQQQPPAPCNGSVELCGRRYDQVTFAATHNAYSYAEGGPVKYTFPSQDRPIPDQLAYGIRALGIRPCPYHGGDEAEQGRVYTTHNCSLKGLLGQEPLQDVLGQVGAFLAANPREVVTLLAESAVSPAEVAGVFASAGLEPYLYTHDATAGWPTLEQMIGSGRRLVVFNDSQEPSRPPWQLFMWDHIVDTDYNVTDKAMFSCAFYRGKPANALYFLNQFIYEDLGNGIVVPSKARALEANDGSFVESRARQCQQETGRVVNFVYVDLYAQGSLMTAVDALNRGQP
jgi:hypothetical protein